MTACTVESTREVLRRAWLAAEKGPQPARAVLAHATRMVTEITFGRALPDHLRELGQLLPTLHELAPEPAQALENSLSEARAEWELHLQEKKCAAGVCFVHHAPPCQAACPANIDIPSFLALIGHDRYQEALEVILADSPLPCSCGMVCPAPCQTACLRRLAGSPVFIRPMKAVAAAYAFEKLGSYPRPRIAPPTGKRVAIVGSGPAGLTAAYYLALKGPPCRDFRGA